MNIYAWIVLAWLFVTLLLNLAAVGKERKPKTARDAVAATIEVMAMGVLVVLAVVS